MKDLTLLTWLTQLGLSAACPLALCLLGALWLRDTLCWGQWVLWAGLVLGLVDSVSSFWHSLKAMEHLSRE